MPSLIDVPQVQAPSLPEKRHFGVSLSRVDIAVLVACLSVLAVVAVPRQLAMSEVVRETDNQALAASLVSATRLANVVWAASNRPPVLRLAGGDVAMVNGYPSAATVFRSLEAPENSAFHFDAGQWRHRHAPDPAACGVVYQPPVNGHDQPTIEVLDAGC